MRLLATPACVSFVCLAMPARAQLNPNLATDSTGLVAEAEAYHYIVSIWGKDVLARGVDLPYPVGINAIGQYITQPIDVSNLQVSFGDGLYGTAITDTTVEVTAPVKISSSVNQTGTYYGVDVTTALPVRTRLISLRFVHTFPRNSKGMKFAMWVGLIGRWSTLPNIVWRFRI